MKENPKPRRRWFPFSLRTMLVLVTVVALFCWYLQWALDWKRQRQAWRDRLDVYPAALDREGVPAPWPLRPLGESGVEVILLDDMSLKDECQQLFPESSVEEMSKPDDFN